MCIHWVLTTFPGPCLWDPRNSEILRRPCGNSTGEGQKILLRKNRPVKILEVKQTASGSLLGIQKNLQGQRKSLESLERFKWRSSNGFSCWSRWLDDYKMEDSICLVLSKLEILTQVELLNFQLNLINSDGDLWNWKAGQVRCYGCFGLDVAGLDARKLPKLLNAQLATPMRICLLVDSDQFRVEANYVGRWAGSVRCHCCWSVGERANVFGEWKERKGRG